MKLNTKGDASEILLILACLVVHVGVLVREAKTFQLQVLVLLGLWK